MILLCIISTTRFVHQHNYGNELTLWNNKHVVTGFFTRLKTRWVVGNSFKNVNIEIIDIKIKTKYTRNNKQFYRKYIYQMKRHNHKKNNLIGGLSRAFGICSSAPTNQFRFHSIKDIFLPICLSKTRLMSLRCGLLITRLCDLYYKDVYQSDPNLIFRCWLLPNLIELLSHHCLHLYYIFR